MSGNQVEALQRGDLMDAILLLEVCNAIRDILQHHSITRAQEREGIREQFAKLDEALNQYSGEKLHVRRKRNPAAFLAAGSAIG